MSFSAVYCDYCTVLYVVNTKLTTGTVLLIPSSPSRQNKTAVFCSFLRLTLPSALPSAAARIVATAAHCALQARLLCCLGLLLVVVLGVVGVEARIVPARHDETRCGRDQQALHKAQ